MQGFNLIVLLQAAEVGQAAAKEKEALNTRNKTESPKNKAEPGKISKREELEVRADAAATAATATSVAVVVAAAAAAAAAPPPPPKKQPDEEEEAPQMDKFPSSPSVSSNRISLRRDRTVTG